MLIVLAAAAAVAAPRPGELKTFQDWVVGCDNGRLCQAVGLAPENDFEAAITAVKRSPEAKAAPEVWITAREVKPAGVRIDGRTFRLSPEQTGGETYRLQDPSGFLQAAIGGRNGELVDSSGRRLAKLSTAGASAALLYMDAAQRRTGTVTALVRRGQSTHVPPPPPLPVIAEVRAPKGVAPKRTVPPRILGRLRTKAECSPDSAGSDHRVEARTLDARTTLFLVPCWLGAYNTSALVLVSRKADRSDVRPAPFDNKTAGDGDPPLGAYWDEQKGRLASHFKGRGLGDCGTLQEWAWDGSRFRLILEESMSECRGSTDYITTWRATVR